jgi:hypothetical protein
MQCTGGHPEISWTPNAPLPKRGVGALIAIDMHAMSKFAMAQLGPHWRKPKSLQDAREMADVIIDHTDQEWLLGFGIEMLGVKDLKEEVVAKWVADRRPPLRQCLPYFIFLLTINVFFWLVLPTQLLSRVKPNHKIDLAYLNYLRSALCSRRRTIFTWTSCPSFSGPIRHS